MSSSINFKELASWKAKSKLNPEKRSISLKSSIISFMSPLKNWKKSSNKGALIRAKTNSGEREEKNA